MCVGLNDIAEEGVFVWTDGSPEIYARYANGQPNNLRNKEDCIVMLDTGNGNHADRPCDELHNFFCEASYERLYFL